MRLFARIIATSTALLSLTLVPGTSQAATVPGSPGTPGESTAAPTGAVDTVAEQRGRRHRPNARRDVYRVNEDRRLRVRPRGVLRNDRDARHRLRAKKVTDPRHGRARLSRRGKLVYKPVADHVGRDRFVYKAVDTRRRSDRAGVVIRTRPVNDAPTFVPGLDLELPALPLPVSIPDWATAVSPGPPDEAGQTVTFLVTVVQGEGLFSTAPTVSPEGVLSVVPSGLGSGTAVLDVVARDDGGTLRRGDDTSDPQRLEISLVPGSAPPTVLDHLVTVPLVDLLLGYELTDATLLAGATDPDGDPLQVTSVTDSEPLLTVTESAGGWTLLATSALLGSGTFPLVYEVSDGNGGTDTGAVDLVVTP